MNKRRLLKLAILLETDAKNRRGIKFDYYNWGAVLDPDKPVSCNTNACALGLAALSGQFKRAGLGYELREGSVLFTMNGRVTGAIRAAMRTFGISKNRAMSIFTSGTGIPDGGDGSKAERAVAERIREFVSS